MTTNNWIVADKDGLSKLVAGQKAAAMVEVAFSNTLDQDVKRVCIDLTKNSDGTYTFRVEDDDPDGFKDLSHAYTMFAESGKKSSATKRGRFNMGEKLLLSLCDHAVIASTTGKVTFREDGKRTTSPTAREAGTLVEAVIRMTKAEVAEWERLVNMVLIPKGVTVVYNGNELPGRDVKHMVPVKALDTVLGQELRPTKRNTKLELVEPLGDETPHLYELGIPVVAVDDMPYHINVMQKVPLTMTRDNVPAPFLRRVRTAVLDATVDEVDAEIANTAWVKDALPGATPEAVRKVVEQRFGEKAVAFDPSDLEANKVATSQGYTVVGGRTFGKDEWAAVRNAGVLPRAGSVTPSNTAIFNEQLRQDGGEGNSEIPQDKWTDAQRQVADYAQRVGKALLGRDIVVGIHNNANLNALAWYGNGRRLGLNVGRLGKAWFEHPDERQIDALLLHEFAHEFASDHLGHEFHDAVCRLGAELKLNPHLHL